MKESLGMVVREVDVQEVWDFIAIWVKKQKSEQESDFLRISPTCYCGGRHMIEKSLGIHLQGRNYLDILAM